MTAPLPLPPELASEPPQSGPATSLPDGIDALLAEISSARVTRVRRRRAEVAAFRAERQGARDHGKAKLHALKLARAAAAASAAAAGPAADNPKDPHE